MHKIFLLAIVIGVTLSSSSVTVKATTACNCAQLKFQADCNAYGSQCTWNGTNNTCADTPCSGITQANCVSTRNCFWNGTACTAFTSCGSLTGATQAACIAQTNNCPYSNGTNCSDKPTAACSTFTAQADCTVGSDGLCLWTTSCVLFNNCNQLTTSQTCSVYTNICAWNATSNTCGSQTCAGLTATAANCMYTLSSPNSNVINVCSVNGTTCVETPPSSLTSSNCLSNTEYQYAWSSNSTDGSCQICNYASIFSALVMAVVLLLA